MGIKISAYRTARTRRESEKPPMLRGWKRADAEENGFDETAASMAIAAIIAQAGTL